MTKKPPAKAGDVGSVSGLGRSLGWVQSLGWEDPWVGEGDGYSLQYSCLENCMDRGVWKPIVHAVAKELGMTY